MKSYEITFKTLLNTLRHQWRLYILIILLFFSLGIASGALWSKKLAAPAAGDADRVNSITFSTIPFRCEPYVSRYLELQTAEESTSKYIQALSAESTLSEAQQAQLVQFTEAFDKYSQDLFLPFQSIFSSESVEDYIHTGSLLRNLSAARRNKAILQGHIEDLLDTAAAAQNAVTESINSFISDIAKTNHLFIRIANVEGSSASTFLIYHTHRAVPASENFHVLVMFCTLIGFITGAYFCLCREAKNDQ